MPSIMREAMSIPSWQDFFPGSHCCSRLRGWREYRRIRHNFTQQARAIKLINAFIDAHTKAQSQIATYFGEGEGVDTPEEAFVIIESQVEVFESATLRGTIEREVQMKVN